MFDLRETFDPENQTLLLVVPFEGNHQITGAAGLKTSRKSDRRDFAVA